MKKPLLPMLALVILCLSGRAWAAADDLVSFLQGGSSTLPSYAWWYGCSPTSAGMMMGYYDRYGYGGLSYSNLVPGVAALTTFPIFNTWNTPVKNIIASQDFVNDFYRYANGTPDTNTSGKGAAGISGDDIATPTGNYNNCLSYFMGTSQGSAPNGSTIFYFPTDGSKLYASDAYNQGLKDGMLGMDLYFRYAGYGNVASLNTDTNFFSQLIQGKGSNPNLGFTFANYVADINAGLVVMIQLSGHSVFGYGYSDSNGQQLIYFYDTWDNQQQSMTWGESWDNMNQLGVTVFTPTGGSPVLMPPSVWLLGSGLLGLGALGCRKKHC